MKRQHVGGKVTDHKRVTTVIWRKIRADEVDGIIREQNFGTSFTGSLFFTGSQFVILLPGLHNAYVNK